MTSHNIDLEQKVFEEIKLVVFNLPGDVNKIDFGINAHKVREVVEVKDFNKLPSSYAPYIGIMNLRGMPIPILDMFSVLDSSAVSGNEEGYTDKTIRVVVCETLGKVVGLLSVSRIKMYEFEDQSILAPTFAHGKVKNEFVSGIIENENKYIFMLNIESVLDDLDSSDFQVARSSEKTYQGKRVLVVEDSHLFRKKLSMFLEKLGFEVSMANNGKEGLEKIKRDTCFDIVFSDIEMPLMNGIEMVRKIKRLPEVQMIPVVFHSSISNEELMRQIKSEKLGDYITKFNEDIILEKLKQIF